MSCLWNAERYRFHGAVLVACHFGMGLCTPKARRLLLLFCALLLHSSFAYGSPSDGSSDYIFHLAPLIFIFGESMR